MGCRPIIDYGDLDGFGVKGSKTMVVKVVIPSEKGRKGIIFRGEDAAEKLLEVLRENRLVN